MEKKEFSKRFCKNCHKTCTKDIDMKECMMAFEDFKRDALLDGITIGEIMMLGEPIEYLK